MKTIPFLYKIIFIAFLFLNSCQKETSDNMLGSTETSNSSLSNKSIANLKNLILDASAEISFPVTVVTYYLNSEQSGSNEFKNEDDLFSFLKSSETGNILASIKYPIQVLDRNKDSYTLKNNTELDDIIENTIKPIKVYLPLTESYLTDDLLDKIRDYLSSYNGFEYPIQFTTGLQNVLQNGLAISTYQATDKQDLINFLPTNSNENLLVAFEYPIEIENTTVRSNLELEVFFESKQIDIKNAIKFITQHNGTTDDFIDNSPNISIQFPFSVTIVNEVIDLTNESNFDNLLSLKINNDNAPIYIEYPINVTGSDGVYTINTIDELNSLQTNYNNDFTYTSSNPFSCIEIVYPVEINTTQGIYSIENDIQFYSDSDSLIDIAYPIQVKDANGTNTTINNDGEFILKVDDCL
ncbi:hypothetical protein [Wenyingzhuangia sp. 2_MG-2023]|uniref:hypothetical protein n=1 Tax=Wenyingzhuangia sp. 2_MG-2023 TaxID=3062639 RepID=UPI0026E338D3|nr:hypothetical protein [Wenyingzhuangia sp. 2_MG-2023]MDO6736689.1 hypothetical protein [Wenyingzhuangia sp. 2_MG-2023]